jgi:hypothetical protein
MICFNMIITGAEVILRVGAGVGILGVIISQEATMVTIVTATAAVKITITVGLGEDVVEATVKAETAVKTAEEAEYKMESGEQGEGTVANKKDTGD